MDSYSGVIRPDDAKRQVHDQRAEGAPSEGVAARSALLAHAGRRDGRCAAVHGRLSLRLHRADVEPLPADRDYAKSSAGHEARPERHREEADEPERPGNRQRPGAGEAVEAAQGGRPSRQRESGLRRGRSPPDGQGRRRAAHRRCNAPTAAGAGSPAGASSRCRTPPPWWFTACKSPSKTTWPWCPACWNAASSG